MHKSVPVQVTANNLLHKTMIVTFVEN